MSEPTKDPSERFVHSGNLGDIIYGLPVIKAKGGGVLCLTKSNGSDFHGMSESTVESIKPLLIQQPYIHDVIFKEHVENKSLDAWRGFPRQSRNLADWQLAAVGLTPECRFEPWIQVDNPVTVAKVIIHRSERYHNSFFPWGRVLQKYKGDIAMIGTLREWELFVREFGHVPYHSTPNLLDVARVISGSKLFIGNQSCPEAIAEAMKHLKVVEVPGIAPLGCIFPRIGAIYVSAALPELPDV